MSSRSSRVIGVDKIGGLYALGSLFGFGWVIGGHHEDISLSNQESVHSAAATRRIAKLLIKPEASHTPEFWEAEGTGVLPTARCEKCNRCMKSGPCSVELDLIKSKTKLVNGEVWCAYAFVKDG